MMVKRIYKSKYLILWLFFLSFYGELCFGESSDITVLLSRLDETEDFSTGYYGIGIVRMSRSDDIEYVERQAAEMAAVFINRQMHVGVVNKSAESFNDRDRKKREFKVVVSAEISGLREISENIDLRSCALLKNYFIGLYFYPGRGVSKEKKGLDAISKIDIDPVSKSDVKAPLWYEDAGDSYVGYGEAFTLADALYDAYEQTLLATARKISVFVFSETLFKQMLKNQYSNRQNISIESLIKLDDYKISNLEFVLLQGVPHFRYGVFLRIRPF